MFTYILLTHFKFAVADPVGKANVYVYSLWHVAYSVADSLGSVLTRPDVMDKHREGSQCPLFVFPLKQEGSA